LRKLKANAVAKSIAGRLVHPRHLFRAANLQRKRRRTKRAYDDAQLALFARILPTGFLHYGYFDDADKQPEDISIADVHRAQRRYAELLLEHAHDRSGPALDVGCGMGGLCAMLRDRGFEPVALTPDRMQARHIHQTQPDVPVLECKFEDLPDVERHAGRYPTVITSESLQYLKLERALPLMDRILKPGGTWIACDFFRTTEGVAGGKGGHHWDTFVGDLARHGWRIEFERDITAHVLPTLRYIHMWACQFGKPAMEFGLLKLRAKQPGVHYVLEDVLTMLYDVIDDNLQIIDPATFVQNKKYVMLVMRRGN
jgi:2-polyprenyl-3-methyl-5-hydroxy-6-metoxy-1,4-benzoquinol methylase